jgi:hypothetical protein
MTWAIEYSQEADSFLVDNYPYTKDLDLAIIALSLTPDGIPATGAHQLEPGVLMCEIERHTVVYLRVPERQTLRILVIKPKESI